MKIKNCILTLTTLASSLLSCQAQNSFQSVGVEEFEKVINDTKVVRLDVRTAEEYADGHLAMTQNLDVRQDEFEARALKALPKDRTIAVYCRSGNRSKKACQILSAKGYNVVELESGYMGWTQAGKPVTKEEVDVFLTQKGTQVALHCIKHGSLSIEVDGKWIYIDPVTSAVQPVTDYSALPKADYILITHEHQDHLDANAISQLTKQGTQLILNPRCQELLEGKGDAMKNGDSKVLAEGWQLNAVPAYNKSAEKQQFHPKGRDNGYVLTIEGLCIYIAGDTEDIDEMKELKGVDIAFLPCNLPFTMTPEQLVNAAKVLNPKVVIPYHYGKTEIYKVRQLLDDSKIDVRIRQYQ